MRHDANQREHSPSSSPTILDSIAHFIERFVFLRQPELYRLIAVWVLATHLHTRFEYMGYLFAHSPEPQSGKSRLLEVLDLLVSNSSGVQVSPTEAVLFRTAHKSTQLLDEADGWRNRDELRSVLNAGYRNGGFIHRMEPDRKGGYKVAKFSVYGPRALAGIGLGILDGTTRDRTFVIEMVRQTPEERREPFRLRKLKRDVEVLRKEIGAWVKEHGQEVDDCYDRSEFPYLDTFRDRTIDVAQPLLAIVEVAYRGNKELEEARLGLIAAVATTRKDQESLVLEHRILHELVRLASKEDPLVGTASELAAKCSGLPEKPSEYTVSGTLRRYGFETKSVRKDGVPKYRYSLPHERLADISRRYACSGSAQGTEVDSDEVTTP